MFQDLTEMDTKTIQGFFQGIVSLHRMRLAAAAAACKF
jgi:hypothetical protein